MMDVTLKQLQVLRAVVVSGSITKASRRLVLSQPSISQQLAKLEERLGAQLIVRNRAGVVNLTPAGEYWLKVGDEVLRRIDTAASEHRSRFIESTVTLRLGLTPIMRGQFLSRAARIASEDPGFVKFELRLALRSADVVEQLHLHQINCAIVTADSMEDGREGYAVTEAFTDPIAFVVPASLSKDAVAAAFRGRMPADSPIRSYIEVESGGPLRGRAEAWYRQHLPEARGAFAGESYPVAIDLCAEGLATLLCPMSIIPNLPATTLAAVRFYRLADLKREMVLVMPRHLLSLGAYSRIYNRLLEFCRTEYVEAMMRPATAELRLPSFSA